MKKVMIDGMMCMHCATRVKRAFEEEGISAEVNLEDKYAYLLSDISDDEIKRIVTNAGYEVKSII